MCEFRDPLKSGKKIENLPGHVATFRKQMRAAADERAAAAADPRGAAVAALHALFGSVPDGATRAAARLLLNELAAALGVEPQRQAHQGGGEAAGLARTGRRREQRRVALMRLRSRGAANGGGIDAAHWVGDSADRVS